MGVVDKCSFRLGIQSFSKFFSLAERPETPSSTLTYAGDMRDWVDLWNNVLYWTSQVYLPNSMWAV